MRGGFVACIGADAATVDQLAERLRWHRGKPLRTGFKGLEVAAFTDSDGPFVSRSADAILVVHGEAIESLPELERTASRFAALHWDGTTLRASRDPMGLAPLFYRQVGRALWFASEVHPLLALAPATADLEALSARVAFVPINERTGWRGIFRVLPGSMIEFAADFTARTTFHWQPERLLGTYRGTWDQAKDGLRRHLEDAVARCHAPGGGIILSGGIDSASVCLAARDCGPAHLVHVYFPDNPQMDERRYAQAVADVVGKPLHEAASQAREWRLDAELERLGLVYNWLPIEVYERAFRHLTENGISSAMDGHDGDGVVGPPGDEWGALLAAGAFARLGALAARGGALKALRGVGASLVPPAIRPWNRGKTYMNRVADYFEGPLRQEVLESDIEDWRPPGRQWARRQLRPLIPQGMIVYEQLEQEAARCGVDLRHPFADRKLAEFMISLPCAAKAEPGRTKGLLRDAFADLLPPIVQTRGKSDSMPLVRQRIDAAGAVDMIRQSDIRLPHIAYDTLFSAAKSAPQDVPLFFVSNLARYHEFARLSAVR